MRLDPFYDAIFVLEDDHWHVDVNRVPNRLDFAWPDVDAAV